MKTRPVDYERLQVLRNEGLTNAAIAAELGCSIRTVDGATKKLGEGRKPPGPRKSVPVLQLFAVWGNFALTKNEVARELGLTDKQLARLQRLHRLPERPQAYRPPVRLESAPDDFGEPEPHETLDLCPWVQKRIEELRLKERHMQEKRLQLWEPALS
jgi:AraC-like DNA-binding protein